MSFRYIGSKARLVGKIGQRIEHWEGRGRFVDAFCGTGAVAQAAATAGWPIHLNDHLACATTMASARLIARSQAKFNRLGGYEEALKALNRQKSSRGFIWKEYSPACADQIGLERRYFREDNAGRIDAIRSMIEAWHAENNISDIEKRLLIADLLGAVSRVANIAGTYGCFMAKWTSQADETLHLRPRRLLEKSIDTIVTTNGVSSLKVEADDLVYLDPPYTKRQYASYYHILETITVGDSPTVEGVAGLRPWRDRASDFCYKARALGAIESLIRGLQARRVLLSYSDEGHVPIGKLTTMLRGIGSVRTYVVKSVGRYRPNRVACLDASEVREYLFVVNRQNVGHGEALSA